MRNHGSKTQHPNRISKTVNPSLETVHLPGEDLRVHSLLAPFFLLHRLEEIECARIMCFCSIARAALIRSLRGRRPTQGCTGCHIRKLFVSRAGAGNEPAVEKRHKIDIHEEAYELSN